MINQRIRYWINSSEGKDQWEAVTVTWMRPPPTESVSGRESRDKNKLENEKTWTYDVMCDVIVKSTEPSIREGPTCLRLVLNATIRGRPSSSVALALTASMRRTGG
ncbi:hypothetical protein ACLOJK_010685 [Asimina triloba]